MERHVMTIATVMVYVDPAQQAEEQVRVARSIATKFKASVIGISAFAVEPDFVAEGVIIQETTPADLKRMKTELAEKERWFRDVVGLPAESGVALGRRISNHVPRQRGESGRSGRAQEHVPGSRSLSSG
jgi:hypothetical protein